MSSVKKLICSGTIGTIGHQDRVANIGRNWFRPGGCTAKLRGQKGDARQPEPGQAKPPSGRFA
jgi:hypothetical protein